MTGSRAEMIGVSGKFVVGSLLVLLLRYPKHTLYISANNSAVVRLHILAPFLSCR